MAGPHQGPFPSHYQAWGRHHERPLNTFLLCLVRPPDPPSHVTPEAPWPHSPPVAVILCQHCSRPSEQMGIFKLYSKASREPPGAILVSHPSANQAWRSSASKNRQD